MKLAVKIPFAMALVTVALGVALAAYLHVSMAAFTDQAARDEALAQLRVASKALVGTGTVPDFAVLDDPGMPAELRASAAAGQRSTLLLQAPDIAWAAEPVTGGKILAVRVSWADTRETLAALDRQLVFGVGVLVGVTGLLALAVARQLSHRLGAAERSARLIADGDLTVRVSDAVSGRDEVAALGRTIDALAASMQERLASEQRVTADIAHDLRTPVTGMVTAAALLPPGRPSELVQSQAQRLWRLVEELLEVARLDHANQPLDESETTTGALARAGSRRSRRLAPTRRSGTP
ncbi:MAG: histidine kinase dimerization/phospho-acceptor domain-containing protein [Dermatophilaceae bacterium]